MIDARVTFVAGETLLSLLRRLAIANYCPNVETLQVDLGLCAKALAAHRPEEVRRLECLLGWPEKTLAPITATRLDHGSRRLGREVLDRNRIRPSSGRVCSRCLAEIDAEGVDLLRWSIRDIEACPLHGTMLRTVSDEHLEKGDIVAAEGTVAEAYFLGRLGLHRSMKVELLDALSWPRAISLVKAIGIPFLLGPSHSIEDVSREARQTAIQQGFRALRHKVALVAALDEIVGRVQPGKEMGFIRTYGEGLRLFLRRDEEGEEGVRAVLREHALDHLPFRAISSIFEATGERTETVVKAARTFGVHPKTFEKILQTYPRPAFHVRHVLVPRTVMRQLRPRLESLMSRSDLFMRLGLSLSHGKALVKAELIRPVYPGSINNRMWSLRDARDFVADLTEGAARRNDVPKGSIGLLDVGKRFQASCVDVVLAVLIDDVEIAAVTREGRLDGIWLDERSTRAFFGRRRDGFGLPVYKAARQLGIGPNVLEGLIADGYVVASSRTVPETGRSGTYVSEDEIERFEIEYVMLQKLARRWRTSMKKAKARAIATGARPCEAVNTPATFFVRREVEIDPIKQP